ncbi:MAG: hypothetical protein QXF12_00445 [Candidatus Aenigmatarchaeota archaeon]
MKTVAGMNNMRDLVVQGRANVEALIAKNVEFGETLGWLHKIVFKGKVPVENFPEHKMYDLSTVLMKYVPEFPLYLLNVYRVLELEFMECLRLWINSAIYEEAQAEFEWSCDAKLSRLKERNIEFPGFINYMELESLGHILEWHLYYTFRFTLKQGGKVIERRTFRGVPYFMIPAMLILIGLSLECEETEEVAA